MDIKSEIILQLLVCNHCIFFVYHTRCKRTLAEVSLVKDSTLFFSNTTAKQFHGDFGSLCWDNAPGAAYSPDISGAIGGTGVEQFCFLPTVSSIDLDQSIIDNQGLNYFDVDENRNAQFLIENDHVPFDNIYSNISNTPHVLENANPTDDRIMEIIEQQIMWERKYLQNRTITGDRDFEAVTSISARKDVRSFSGQYDGETGDFIIESGKTTFSAPEVILEGGFEVKNGAEFEIK